MLLNVHSTQQYTSRQITVKSKIIKMEQFASDLFVAKSNIENKNCHLEMLTKQLRDE